MAKKKKDVQYEGPATINYYKVEGPRVQFGDRPGPVRVADEGDLVIELDDDLIVIGSANADDVIQLIQWFKLIGGDIGNVPETGEAPPEAETDPESPDEGQA